MADLVLSEEKFWLHGYDVSGNIKGADFQVTKDALDNTVFGNTTRSRKGGLEDISLALAGFWYANSAAPIGIDDILSGRIGVSDSPFSVGTPTGAAGDVGYTFRCHHGEYQAGSEVGQLLEFTVTAQASGGDPCARGLVLFNSTGLSSSGNGTKFQLGAISASQKLYASLHVLGAGTGTFDGVLQSDADSSSGGETNRITFTQASGITSEWKTLSGAVTDTWWRLNYTIAGGAPSFAVVLVAGIK